MADVLHTTRLIGDAVKYWLCDCGEVYKVGEKHSPITRVEVILFKPSGKYYTTDYWTVPTEVPGVRADGTPFTRESIGPYDMAHSPSFRRIDGGAVLVPSQEPWGFPVLFPGVAEEVDE